MREHQIVIFPRKTSISENMAFAKLRWIFVRYKNMQLKIHLQIHWLRNERDLFQH